MAGTGEVRAGGAYIEIYAKDATAPGLSKIAGNVKNKLRGSVGGGGFGFGGGGGGAGRGILGALRGAAPISSMAGLGGGAAGLAGIGGAMAATGPLAGVAAGLAALGAAAIRVDGILREKSPGYTSALEGLGKAASKAFDELGYAVLPVVSAIAKALTPAFDWLAAKIREYAPLFLEFAAGFADALQMVYQGFAYLKIGIAEVARVIGMLVNDLDVFGLLGDDFLKRWEAAVDKEQAASREAINAAPWGDSIRKAAADINAARSRIGTGTGKLPSNIQAPSALVAGTQALQDMLAQGGADRQLDLMRDMLDVQKTIADNTAPTAQPVGGI